MKKVRVPKQVIKKQVARSRCSGIPTGRKYQGKYVATSSFNSKAVIASGKDPLSVIKRASAKGHEDAVIAFIPDSKTYYIF